MTDEQVVSLLLSAAARLTDGNAKRMIMCLEFAAVEAMARAIGADFDLAAEEIISSLQYVVKKARENDAALSAGINSQLDAIATKVNEGG